ncbi:MAG: sensor histidine kinase [Proteobacteria bacterium]|nr:sensor histidine kinase [Pseudomonadota bacterium]NCA28118.1 sensor histidine kinase [Pseudomonadota bacterium]
MTKNLVESDLENFSIFENDDDIGQLSLLVNSKPEASIICSYNSKVPNFLSIIQANSEFYKLFMLDETRVIGQNYDFLFDDIELDNFSEDQIEYSRLIRAVRDKTECVAVVSSSFEHFKFGNFKLHISFHPHQIKSENTIREYGIFSFIKVDNNSQNEDRKLKSRANISLLRVLERTLRNERTLREIANLIISDEKIDNLARAIAKILCEHLKCDRCIIHDFKKNRTDFVIEYSSIFSDKIIPDKITSQSIENIQRYINFQNNFYKKFGVKNKKSSISIINDITNDNNFNDIRDICSKYSISSQIAITTNFNGIVNGAIYLHQSEKRTWIQDEIDFIEIVAEQFSIALDRSSSIQKVMIANHSLMEKTLQLKDALKQEQEMRKMQNEFVALVSHEFKTPLQIIDGNRELIARKLKNNNYPQDGVFSYLEKIKSGIQRMNGLINSTLHLAKMENSDGKIKVDLQEFDLCALVSDIIDKNYNLAQQKNIQIHMRINDLPKSYVTDQKLLDHALSNIVSNAIKYSNLNSNVKVIGKILDDCIAIRVIDSGIGIPEKDLYNIGKKFFRAGNSISVAGTGIGIYLTKHFIDLLAGKLIIESKEGVGTTVTIILKK